MAGGEKETGDSNLFSLLEAGRQRVAERGLGANYRRLSGKETWEMAGAGTQRLRGERGGLPRRVEGNYRTEL